LKFDARIHHRHSIRLKGYDYRLPGAYFVTLCTWQRECTFGEVVGGEVRLSPAGLLAQKQWLRLEKRFPEVDLPAFVIMPNHVHGIIMIRDTPGRGAGEDLRSPRQEDSPLRPYSGPRVAAGSLGAIVRSYKASVTWRIHAMNGYSQRPVWQRNYYEHIVRHELELQSIWNYIDSNPLLWKQDQLHPDAPPNRFNQE
jgi:REP element-mobilizing transposase RayT